MLACFEAWGIEKTLASALGMFAIALYDPRLGVVHLVPDRLGVKPLYYCVQGQEFLFASEVKGILVALRRIMRAIDLYSRQLMEEYGLTGPQLAALHELARMDSCSPTRTGSPAPDQSKPP